ncbi:glycoside hydrolase family 43 protein [Sphingomonas carotinifaciens]|uniref:glycoside hydrolase family 43 protein n=2 Tax=Sphingomonas TaxID=13687 RepID=UPI001F087316|nr:glycoside hydrolase family 43 protein [Sphingomonas carotinifaciens]
MNDRRRSTDERADTTNMYSLYKYAPLAAAIALGACAAAGSHSALDQKGAATFTNPLLPSGPDPWVTQEGGVYYYTHTLGDRIGLWRTRDVTDLEHAEYRTVWTPPAQGPNAHSIWAPELHRINKKWYLYYSATASGFKDDAHRGVFVLENASIDPFQGGWVDRGRVNTAWAGIDGTVFEHRGTLYFAYSPYLDAISGIALARLSDPWTIAGDEVVVAKADQPFENQGGRQIMEGPEFLAGPRGQVFLTYSAGACWSDNYALGLLRADGSNLLSPTAWTKSPIPVLASGNGVFATGHNGFFRSPDGREQWIVFHGNPAANMGCTARRAPYLSRVRWTASGEPKIDPPSSPDTRIAKPGGMTER